MPRIARFRGPAAVAAPFHLLLPAQFVEQMFAQAKAELPNECCGLLAGTVAPAGTGRVGRRYPLTKAAGSPLEYPSGPRVNSDMQRDPRRAWAAPLRG